MSHTERTPMIEVSDLSMEQEAAVAMGCDMGERVVGITGGAGTGKTSVLGKMYEELVRVHSKASVVLCAPTGRAAKRIQEATGIPALTVHKLLEFPTPDDPIKDEEGNIVQPDNKPRRDKFNPLVQRIVLLDEASMVGPTLYAYLMDALPKNGVVRFFGDNNQLPPVEPGTPPFLDILRRKAAIELTFNFRSDDHIVANAQRILNGNIPIRNPRFEVIYSNDPIKELLNFADKTFVRHDHQIIMPTRKGKYGTIRVNPSLQLKYNPTGAFLRLDRHDGSEAPLAIKGDDKFLWIKNDYALNMFNGEIGKVDWVNPEDGTLRLAMPEREVLVPARVKAYSAYHGSYINYDPRKNIELGYAVTTHKAQGSEFHTIIYCVCAGQAYLLNRRNLYTAVTRAKHQVIVITDRRGMNLSLRRAQVNV